MNPKVEEITKKQLITLAKQKGIKEPHKMSTKNLYLPLIGTKKACKTKKNQEL